jgi:hypothetical protein
MPKEVTKTRELYDMLSDILDTISDINPLLRSIVRDQGHWDLDRLEERINDLLRDEEERRSGAMASIASSMAKAPPIQRHLPVLSRFW